MESTEFTLAELVQWNHQFPENPPGSHMVTEETTASLIK